MSHDLVLIVDFGSQVTQLIARRVREAGVYCEIHPVLEGGRSVRAAEAEGGDPVRRAGVGARSRAARARRWRSSRAAFRSSPSATASRRLCEQLGGKVESGHAAEFGRADVEILAALRPVRRRVAAGRALSGVDEPRRPRDPAARRFPRLCGVGERALRRRGRRERAAITRRCSIPEVVHTPDGAKLIANFLFKIAGLKGDWTMAAFRDEEIARIRAQVGKSRVICGLSGGVDSAVAAVLIHEAIGDQLICVFVDHGLLATRRSGRSGRPLPRPFQHPARSCRRGARRSCRRSTGVEDPEAKRKTIGKLFIDTFEAEARRIASDGKGPVEFLAQGTLYPDVIESVSFSGGPSVTIKSHHNVGGLPERMRMKLVEPLRELFKDEVRALGRELGLPEAFVGRHPFPGTGPRRPLPGRRHPREARHPAQGRRHLSRRDPQGGPLRQNLAKLRRPVAGAHRRRHG